MFSGWARFSVTCCWLLSWVSGDFRAAHAPPQRPPARPFSRTEWARPINVAARRRPDGGRCRVRCARAAWCGVRCCLPPCRVRCARAAWCRVRCVNAQRSAICTIGVDYVIRNLLPYVVYTIYTDAMLPRGFAAAAGAPAALLAAARSGGYAAAPPIPDDAGSDCGGRPYLGGGSDSAPRTTTATCNANDQANDANTAASRQRAKKSPW